MTSPEGTAPERITVNLTPKSVQALVGTMKQTEATKTEVVNRALQVYAHLQDIWHNGGTVLVRETPKSDIERLRVF